MAAPSSFTNITGGGRGGHFPDPFMDIATMSMPQSMRTALLLCEYVYMSSGTLRMALERIIAYFMTEIEFGDDETGDEEKDKWLSFMNETLGMVQHTQLALQNRACFHGDVKAVTRNGIFKLHELAGKTVDVLTLGGIYRPAVFKSFGVQELLEVEFSDGRTVLATPEHQWIAMNCSGKILQVPTTKLTRGYRIERVVAPRPDKDEDYYEGIRHGFVFGDGSTTNGGRQCVAYFYGDKAALIPYFKGYGNQPRRSKKRITIYGLPSHYKRLPANDRSASYWYGFVSGFLAADGTVDIYGCAMLTQVAKASLEAIEAQLPRIGMVGGPIRCQRRTAHFKPPGKPAYSCTGDIHYLTLLKHFMLPQDLLLAKHRAKFENNFKKTEYGKRIGVRSVRTTGIVSEVFCCVEKTTHTFVIGNGILTGNCYGNSFTSVLKPFKRFLRCPKCYSLYPLNVVYNTPLFNFAWSMPQFVATCPSCRTGSGYRGPFIVDDKDDDVERKLRIKHWSPHEIEILHDYYTDETAYLWRIPEDYKAQVRKGNLYHLERVSKPVLEAVRMNRMFRFNPDVIFHMKEPTLAGIRNRGWGIPRILSNFRQVYYVQVLRRYNEAIALDYVIPFRLITPMPRPGAGASVGAGGQATDPMTMFNMGDFRSQINRMLKRRQRDPASWNVLPFPVQYQQFGGDASKLAPKELMDQGTEDLLNAIGSPIELYKGTLSLQAAGPALRLFESTWGSLVFEANSFMRWAVRQISQIMSWEVVDPKLKRVTIADDMNKAMAQLQLLMGQQVSGTTAFKGLGMDWKSEQKRMSQEALTQAKIQSEAQEQMDQAGFAQQVAKGQGAQQGGAGGAAPGGAPGGGGAPPAGAPAAPGTAGQPGPVTQFLSQMGPNTPVDPVQMSQAGDNLATELLGLPDAVKNQQLRELKAKNDVLHAITVAKIKSYRQGAKQQGGAQVMAQQFGKPGG